MTTSTYSDVIRMQRRTTQHQRLAVAITLVLVAVSGTTLVHVGAFNAQINGNVSEQTRMDQPAPVFVQIPARPY